MKLALPVLRVKMEEVDPMKATVPRDKQVLPFKQEVDGEFAPLSDAVDAASNVLEAFGASTGDPNAQAAIIGPKLRETYEEVYERVLALVGGHDIRSKHLIPRRPTYALRRRRDELESGLTGMQSRVHTMAVALSAGLDRAGRSPLANIGWGIWFQLKDLDDQIERLVDPTPRSEEASDAS